MKEKNNIAQPLYPGAATPRAADGGGLPAPAPAAPTPPGELERTPGLKAVDGGIYVILTNSTVLGLSVLATYLTSRGGARDANGKLIYGKVGEFFQKRGEWMTQKFRSAGMTHDQADMAKMVFFSWFDGSLLAPMVKVLEDRREKFAMAIDKCLGTLPKDHSVYDAEPEQGWMSVLGGRLATSLIVVPTAVALDKAGLNRVLFAEPGRKIGEMIARKPNLAKYFGKLDIPEISKIGAFEAFYTSVCTAGLYFSSRALARLTGKHKKSEAPAAEDAPLHIPLLPCADTTPAPHEKTGATPRTEACVGSIASSRAPQHLMEHVV